MAPQIVVSADPPAVDEGLRRGRDAMFGLECVGFLARFEPMVVDVEAVASEQMPGLQPIGADVARHDHAIEGGGACLFRNSRDRKSTRMNSVTNAHLVCRLLLQKKHETKTENTTNT